MAGCPESGRSGSSLAKRPHAQIPARLLERARSRGQDDAVERENGAVELERERDGSAFFRLSAGLHQTFSEEPCVVPVPQLLLEVPLPVNRSLPSERAGGREVLRQVARLLDGQSVSVDLLIRRAFRRRLERALHAQPLLLQAGGGRFARRPR